MKGSKGSHDARIWGLERRLNPEANRHPMSTPISERDLAFLREYEKVTDSVPVEERQDVYAGPALVLEAAANALEPLGYTDEQVEDYADETWSGFGLDGETPDSLYPRGV